jgi:hypothetical protein
MFFGCEREHVGYADICRVHEPRVRQRWQCQCGAESRIMKTEPI